MNRGLRGAQQQGLEKIVTDAKVKVKKAKQHSGLVKRNTF